MVMRPTFIRRVAAVTWKTNKRLSSRSLSSVSPSLLPDVTLYQYHICPFCHKTKALMGYAGISPKIVEVNPLNKAELKQTPDQSYRKVPIAIIGGDQQVNGSDEISRKLMEHQAVRDAILSKSPSIQDMHEFATAPEEWVRFASDDLAALLYPNICSSLGDSYTAFGYVNQIDAFSFLQKFSIRAAGSVAMYMAAASIKKKRGIQDERAALQESLKKWQKEGLGGGSKLFASGKDDPNWGDLAVFGTLRSVEGLPAHDAMIMNNEENAKLKDWYLRVRERVAV